MEIRFLRDLSEWEALAGAWNDLLSRSATDIPFLRYEFLRAWWTTLGGGEWPDGELSIAIGLDDHGGLAAAAPFFRTSVRPGALLFVGTAEISDYLDVLAPAAALEPFCRSLLETVARGALPGVMTIDLWNVQETSPGEVAIASAAEAAGWSIDRTRLKPCPLIRLDGGWEAYLGRLDKKQRHELRRKMRRVMRTPGAGYARAGESIDLSPAMEEFLRLMALDPAKARFLTPAMQAMFQSLARSAAGAGWLRLEFVTVGGRAVAGAFCFDYGERLLVYNSGIDPGYLELSPGWALLGHLIRTAAEEGKTAVDLMRGGEDYKFRLGGEARYIERLTLTRRPF